MKFSFKKNNISTKLKLLSVVIFIVLLTAISLWKINNSASRVNKLPTETCLAGEGCQTEINSPENLEKVYQEIINEPIDQIDAERTAIEQDFDINSK